MTQKRKMPKRETLDELLRVGGMMSNICFNTSQRVWTVSERYRENMRLVQKLWDETVKKTREEMQ